MGAEPKVLTADVAAIIRRRIDPADGESARQFAERAGTSERTLKRVLRLERETIALDLADRLVMAAGSTLSICCRAQTEDGRVIDYVDA